MATKGSRRSQSGLTLLAPPSAPAPMCPDEARLETFANPRPGRCYWIHLECPEFTAVCPITGQPDFGVLAIDYVPGRRCLESKSLKLYLGSFRNQGVFHENVVNRILDDLVAACRPRRLRVTGRFNARGGIAITVTAEHPAGRPAQNRSSSRRTARPKSSIS